MYARTILPILLTHIIEIGLRLIVLHYFVGSNSSK